MYVYDVVFSWWRANFAPTPCLLCVSSYALINVTSLIASYQSRILATDWSQVDSNGIGYCYNNYDDSTMLAVPYDNAKTMLLYTCNLQLFNICEVIKVMFFSILIFLFFFFFLLGMNCIEKEECNLDIDL